jgi:hypothetical protein
MNFTFRKYEISIDFTPKMLLTDKKSYNVKKAIKKILSVTRRRRKQYFLHAYSLDHKA